MKKRRIFFAALILVIILLFIPLHISRYDDGGTVTYHGILLTRVKYYHSNPNIDEFANEVYFFPKNWTSLSELYDAHYSKGNYMITPSPTPIETAQIEASSPTPTLKLPTVTSTPKPTVIPTITETPTQL